MARSLVFSCRLCALRRRCGSSDLVADDRARLAVVLQRIAPDLVAHLWQVRQLRHLPFDVRETVADLLGCEAASRGLDGDEEPNAYGRELGELFAALGL